MQKTPRLTTRNLFDEVFATIPADVVLNTGPASLREKYALMESIQAENEEQNTDGITFTTEEGGDNGSAADDPGPNGNLTEEGILDFSAVMRHAAKRTEEQQHGDQEQGGEVHRTIDLQLDAEDEAVQEAMKYASLFDDVEQPQRQQSVGVDADGNEGGDGIVNNTGDGGPGVGASSKGTAGGMFTSSHGTRHHTMQHQHQHQQTSGSAQNAPRRQLTAEEQIALMCPGDGRRHTGRCVLFRQNKNFGFIAPDIGNPDVYFTRESIEFTFTRRVLEAFFGMPVSANAQHREGGRDDGVDSRQSHRRQRRHGSETVSNTSGTNNCNNEGSGNEAVLDGFAIAERNIESSCTGEVIREEQPALPVAETNAGGEVSLEQPPDSDTVTSRGDKKGNGVKAMTTVGVSEIVQTEEVKEKPDDGSAGSGDNGGTVANAEANDMIQRAAALLTPEAARLLALFLQVGQPVLLVGEPLTFTVRWNTSVNRTNRRLRADNIGGLPINHHALAIEQSWFSFVFNPGAERGRDGRGNRNQGVPTEGSPSASAGESVPEEKKGGAEEKVSVPGKEGGPETGDAVQKQGGNGLMEGGDSGGVTVKENEGGKKEKRRERDKGGTGSERPVCSVLRRYRGVIYVYDADEHRGHIRPEVNGSSTVQFSSDAFLWASWMEAGRRRPAEGLVVNYSLGGTNKGGKHIATLITATDDTALSDTNLVWETKVANERALNIGRTASGNGSRVENGDGDRRNGGAGGATGAGGNRDEGAKGRKRGRDEELPLLEEDDYGIM
ncbi:hypothetical protein, conserved [Trypanosoma brucei brucei TREU927]|uniref:CSD domain-containing protein n=1 Tax=Trypanosoma brucei brucei (strain 927/4 GUTat10.1) TaxID=185431 RepID=Q4GYD7_TRYB2|nr:hypothetical protein, conserved [Trypanosoma brucei brucei TREU927]CAJ16647.1 hypothetical protein, conserved [Trypanosoma brucei brucei TREU927]